MTENNEEIKEPPKVKEFRIRKIKITIPHPALTCPKVRKQHYRKWLLITLIAIPFVHFMTPEWEYLAAMVNGFVFYYEPVLEIDG